MCRDQKGFTLIELLVVVAIIALLTAILLPSLSRAKATARNTICQSQLREYGKAMSYYLGEYRDVFPPHRQVEPGIDRRGYPHWYNLLDYYWLGEFVQADPRKPEEIGVTLRVARCPELEEMQVSGDMDWSWAYDARYIGYGYNAFWLGLWAWAWDTGEYTGHPNVHNKVWARLSDVRSPSECISVADTNVANYGQHGEYSSTLLYIFMATLGEGVSTRHFATGNSAVYAYDGAEYYYPNGTGNICFVDGHVAGRRSEEVNRIVKWRKLWDHKQNVGGLYNDREPEED